MDSAGTNGCEFLTGSFIAPVLALDNALFFFDALFLLTAFTIMIMFIKKVQIHIMLLHYHSKYTVTQDYEHMPPSQSHTH